MEEVVTKTVATSELDGNSLSGSISSSSFQRSSRRRGRAHQPVDNGLADAGAKQHEWEASLAAMQRENKARMTDSVDPQIDEDSHHGTALAPPVRRRRGARSPMPVHAQTHPVAHYSPVDASASTGSQQATLPAPAAHNGSREREEDVTVAAPRHLQAPAPPQHRHVNEVTDVVEDEFPAPPAHPPHSANAAPQNRLSSSPDAAVPHDPTPVCDEYEAASISSPGSSFATPAAPAPLEARDARADGISAAVVLPPPPPAQEKEKTEVNDGGADGGSDTAVDYDESLCDPIAEALASTPLPHEPEEAADPRRDARARSEEETAPVTGTYTHVAPQPRFGKSSMPPPNFDDDDDDDGEDGGDGVVEKETEAPAPHALPSFAVPQPESEEPVPVTTPPPQPARTSPSREVLGKTGIPSGPKDPVATSPPAPTAASVGAPVWFVPANSTPPPPPPRVAEKPATAVPGKVPGRTPRSFTANAPPAQAPATPPSPDPITVVPPGPVTVPVQKVAFVQRHSEPEAAKPSCASPPRRSSESPQPIRPLSLPRTAVQEPATTTTTTTTATTATTATTRPRTGTAASRQAAAPTKPGAASKRTGVYSPLPKRRAALSSGPVPHESSPIGASTSRGPSHSVHTDESQFPNPPLTSREQRSTVLKGTETYERRRQAALKARKAREDRQAVEEALQMVHTARGGGGGGGGTNIGAGRARTHKYADPAGTSTTTTTSTSNAETAGAAPHEVVRRPSARSVGFQRKPTVQRRPSVTQTPMRRPSLSASPPPAKGHSPPQRNKAKPVNATQQQIVRERHAVLEAGASPSSAPTRTRAAVPPTIVITAQRRSDAGLSEQEPAPTAAAAQPARVALFCTSCGEKYVADGARFCAFCGHKREAV